MIFLCNFAPQFKQIRPWNKDHKRVYTYVPHQFLHSTRTAQKSRWKKSNKWKKKYSNEFNLSLVFFVSYSKYDFMFWKVWLSIQKFCRCHEAIQRISSQYYASWSHQPGTGHWNPWLTRWTGSSCWTMVQSHIHHLSRKLHQRWRRRERSTGVNGERIYPPPPLRSSPCLRGTV